MQDAIVDGCFKQAPMDGFTAASNCITAIRRWQISKPSFLVKSIYPNPT